MGVLAALTRMWLTRSPRPFVFRDEGGVFPDFADCENPGLYIHIPFCRSLCAFCPYCKVVHSPELLDRYVDSLVREIHLTGGRAPGRKRVSSLYFGGGTPALAVDRLPEILAAVAEHFTVTEGVGTELHPDDVTPEVLGRMAAAGVTKISIGVQSFHRRHQDVLGRRAVDPAALAAALAAVPFPTVSMDFIFALPGQTFEELRTDVDTAFALGANHVALYPFIDFTFTGSRIPPMPKREKRALLDAITRHCLDRGCVRGSLWTFARDPAAVYSSMTRENFLGFGCSATSLTRDRFTVNTFDIEAYRRRIAAGVPPTSLTLRFTRRQRMLYWLFWTAYGTRVRERDFADFFGVPLRRMYGAELWLAKLLGLVTERDGVWEMTLKGAFYYHHCESFYTLAYIDRMWGIMRREAFPARIEL